MPTLFNEEIDKYVVDLFELPGANYERELRLTLKSGPTVSIRFPDVPPGDFIDDLAPTFTVVQLAAARFDQIYHLLQTESPVFFTGYEYILPGTTIRFAGLSSDPEPTGEGFRDAETLASP
jgi:hypothetical protein